MSNVVDEKRLICTDIGKNSNKYWHGSIHDLGGGQHVFRVHFGRVGYEGTPKDIYTGSLADCQRKMQSKVSQKGRGKADPKNKSQRISVYQEQKTIGGTTGSANSSQAKSVTKANLKRVATQQIETKGCKVAAKLVSYLSDRNIHNIVQATTLKYDDTTGLFATPLGVVTQDAIDDARDLLGHLGVLIGDNKFGNSRTLKLLGEYLQLIPTKVALGRKSPEQFVKTILPNVGAVQQQNSILDSLQASLHALETKPQKKQKQGPDKSLFDVELSVVDDPKILMQITTKFERTKKGMHQCSHLKVKKVFKVRIGQMDNAFKSKGARMDNIWQLWHGSQVANLLSILHKGFFVPPPQAQQCTGRMFGDGIYGSDISTKALNYAYGFWSARGGRDENCFMFLIDFAMGKIHTPKTDRDGPFPRRGYDSVFAKEGMASSWVGRLKNNEMIVYDVSQINPKYLVQFGR